LNPDFRDPILLHTEAVIFCAAEPISLEEIRAGLSENFQTEIDAEKLREVLKTLQERYNVEEFSFQLEESAGGFHFLTKAAFQSSVTQVWKQKVKKRLSPSALETLSIIAYKQPVTKPDIEKIRGVNCDYAVQKLLEKELITIAGKSKLPGKPVLYGTSKKFMDYFGLNSLEELPELREILPEENTIGEAAE
jgi:segregation and condensation protein B